ncbi:MAG: TOBE domain-containing protein, partial [Terriglobia bacterium]
RRPVLRQDSARDRIRDPHDQGEALIMADRLAVMKDGRILQTGRPEDIIYSPSDAWVAGFVGMDTVLSGTVVSRQQEFAVVEVGSRLIKAVLPPGVTGRVRIGIRPEEVMLSRAFEPAGQPRQRAAANGPSAGPKPNENVFRGRITEVTPQGLLLKIQLDCEFPLASLIPNELMSGVGFRPGQVIDASFDPNAVCLIAD